MRVAKTQAKMSTYRQECQSLSSVGYLPLVLEFVQNVASTRSKRFRLCEKAINRPPLQLRQTFEKGQQDSINTCLQL